MATVQAALPFLEFESDPLLAGSETREYSDFISPASDPTRVDRIVDQLLLHRSDPLWYLLPGLTRNGHAPIPLESLSASARLVLERRSIRSWTDLAQLSPDDLRSLPSSGELMIREILRVALDYADPGATKRVMLFEEALEAAPFAADDRSDDLLTCLRRMAAWAVRERSIEAISELLEVASGLNPPDGLLAGWRLLDLDVSDLADAHLTEPPLGVLYERLVAEMEPSRRLVLEQRLLALDPKTLAELGKFRGVSREAVRQDEKKLKRDLTSLLSREEFMPFAWRAWDLAASLGGMSAAASPSVVRALDHAVRDVDEDHRLFVLQLLLHLAGPYEEWDGWLVRHGMRGVPSGSELWATVAPAVIVDLAACRAWLAARHVGEEHLQAWLEGAKEVRLHQDNVLRWDGSVVDKAISLLTLWGEPATADELVESIGEGHNIRGVRNRLFDDERLMRVDKHRFALRQWGMEEYSGIAEEIAQRIREHGGEAPLDEVVRELVETFGVAEASVRAYADAPMFVRDGNRVRMRGSDEEYAAGDDLSGCAGVFRMPDGGISYTIQVDSDVLRGSGRGLPRPLSVALGVAPGKERTFYSDLAELRVMWPTTSPTGAALGSTRSFALALNLSVGDLLRLSFDPAGGEVTAVGLPMKDLASLPAPVAMEGLTGLQSAGEDPRQILGEAIGIAAGSVERVLRERGDERVAKLLPEQQPDDDLNSALEGLAELLGSLE